MTENLYMLEAIRRPKDPGNEGLPNLCFRQIMREFETDREVLRARVAKEPGTWRLYRSVNRRDFQKAYQALYQGMLFKMLRPETSNFAKVDSEWKTCLMQPENKAERLYLIDCDTKDDAFLKAVNGYLNERKVDIHEFKLTPNGAHLVVDPLDVREFNSKFFRVDAAGAEVKKDALLFLEILRKAFQSI